MLIKMLSLLIIFALSFSLAGASSDMERLYEKSFDCKPNDKLIIEESIGDVIINSWDKDQIVIVVYGNENFSKQADVKFEKTNNEIKIKLEKKSLFTSFKKVNCKFEIQLPGSFNLDIETAGGDINVVKVSGDFKLATAGGDLKISQSNGKLQGSTAGGNVVIADYQGSLEVSTAGGDIELDVKNSVIDASTAGGDVELSYTGENKGIDLSSMGGDIVLSIPGDLQAQIDLTTMGGSIKSDVEISKIIEKDHSSLTAELNGGGKLINCSTMGGNIYLKKQAN